MSHFTDTNCTRIRGLLWFYSFRFQNNRRASTQEGGRILQLWEAQIGSPRQFGRPRATDLTENLDQLTVTADEMRAPGARSNAVTALRLAPALLRSYRSEHGYCWMRSGDQRMAHGLHSLSDQPNQLKISGLLSFLCLTNEIGPCLVHPKIQKHFKIFRN